MRLVFFFVIAFLIRLLLIPNPGFEADVSFWKSWGLATYDRGIVEGMHITNNNYPTPFAYTLGAMVNVYSLAADPHNFNEFWQNTNLLFLAISKALPILADFGIAGVILWIGRSAKRLGFPTLPFTLYSLLSLMYLLSPISLIDGAWWGQVDSVGVFLFLLALAAALSKKSFLAGLLFMVAMMTKLQNMIYGPLFFLFIWRLTGFTGLVRAAAGAIIGFFGTNIEFFLQKDMARVVASLTENFDYFPLMSLNAYNLWWIVTLGRGMQVSDKVMTIGITNAKTVGLLLFSGSYLFAVGILVHDALGNWKSKLSLFPPLSQPELTRRFLVGLIVIAGAFFLFQTQSHDRYAFPISVFLLLLAPFVVKLEKETPSLWQNRSVRSFMLLYTLFSLLYFYNLHTALVVNYPNNGIPVLSSLTQPALTIAASVGLLLLFGAYLWFLRREASPLLYGICVLVVVLGISAVNQPLLAKKPIALSTLVPIVSQQDFGQLARDMAVGGSFGPAKWTRLSVQYAFYRHGIGTHANSRHTFDINRKFTRFTFDYGIDTEAGERGSAIFEVYGDDTLLFHSEKIGRFDLPRHGEANVQGVKMLSLVTRDAGDGITDDHTDWLNPLLWP